MSQAMMMRIIALERRMERLESVIDAHFHAHEPSFETGEPPYQVVQHGAAWYRVFGPEGEITEKGLRRHEAQALADDLNAQ